jgi:type IV secretion system protein VirB1
MSYVVQPFIARTTDRTTSVRLSDLVSFIKENDPFVFDAAYQSHVRWTRVLCCVTSVLLFFAVGRAYSLGLSDSEVNALAEECARGSSAQTLVAVSRTESGFNPWALHDNTTGISESPVSAEAADSDATAWINRGDSVDIGLMQINSANLPALGMTVQAALDPCASLAGGASVLQAAYGGGTANANDQVALLMALSRYNTGSPFRGIMNGYAHRVIASADGAALAPARNTGIQTFTSDPNAPPAWDISATGAYAQTHGASWLVSLGTPAAAGTKAPIPMAPAAPQDASMSNKDMRVVSNQILSTTQQEARSP